LNVIFANALFFSTDDYASTGQEKVMWQCKIPTSRTFNRVCGIAEGMAGALE
jgi:hypothetical protein